MTKEKSEEKAVSQFKNIAFENRELVEQYFQVYKKDSAELDSSWIHFFNESPQIRSAKQQDTALDVPCQVTRIKELIRAYRQYGHLAATVNPINQNLQTRDVALLQYTQFGFQKEDEPILFPTCGLLNESQAPLLTIVSTLQAIYAKRIGIEYYPFVADDVESWIQKRFEPLGGIALLSKEEKLEIYRLLSQAELFETFLHTRFVGQKRFSLEGAETLIPMLFLLFERSAKLGAEEIVLGMPHRGRLNVLANIFQKPLNDIITEFHPHGNTETKKSGDVKYHKGFSSRLQTAAGKDLQLKMCHNPSHLESVDPVCQGVARAKQEIEHSEYKKIVPILIHGDSAIAGQGVVYETLQLSRLQGYTVGGTIHFVINNQIGFTVLPEDSRSTRYCTDIAKAFGIPVFHVNAEDPEMCVWATLCALDLRTELNTDVIIDLNCYRKYGHNESDEPAFTQPLLYEMIRQKKSIRELYQNSLLKEENIDKEAIETEYRRALHEAYEEVTERKAVANVDEQALDKQEEIKKVDPDELIKIARSLITAPEEFTVHPRLKKNREQRLHELEEKKLQLSIDWSFAEALAFGTILLEKTPIRLIGQDTRRGTFSQRHAALCDQKNGAFYYPLQALENGALFSVYDSLLSEFAALGFEYGYSLGNPKALVLWEAQFGDFANGAQIIIDQYIAAGESKWGNRSRLTLLLPHGYEGQGPEHSSARMERFLQLAAEENLILANPTTPAQYFYLLRRQARLSVCAPLIIFTPKGLLRHSECKSTLESLTAGQFQEIIDDTLDHKKVKRLLFCQGKIYYDLVAKRRELAIDDIAIIRIEQLYPLDIQKVREIISSYGAAHEFFWVQEEPMNAGAWSYIHDMHFASLQYVGRKRTASPAVSSHEVHVKEQNEILESVFRRGHHS